ncbi:hypothetical protein MP638_006377 [Amoeboaphelidium occidentale]|nr:hypothetical protein MP638_006377 [Amoeboaphelidium occidentale]
MSTDNALSAPYEYMNTLSSAPHQQNHLAASHQIEQQEVVGFGDILASTDQQQQQQQDSMTVSVSASSSGSQSPDGTSQRKRRKVLAPSKAQKESTITVKFPSTIGNEKVSFQPQLPGASKSISPSVQHEPSRQRQSRSAAADAKHKIATQDDELDSIIERETGKYDSNEAKSVSSISENSDTPPYNNPQSDQVPSLQNSGFNVDRKSVKAGRGSMLAKLTGHRATCQSCQHKTPRAYKIPINTHLHVDPFYSKEALVPSLNQLNGLSNIVGTTFAEHGVGANGHHYVSVKSSIQKIPVEYVTLCQVCASCFEKTRKLCDECFFVPKPEEAKVQECVHCFEGVISKH